MRLSPFNRALLRGVLAGAVALTGTACSRSDKTESGSNNSATVLPDSGNGAVQPSDTGAAAGAVKDTAATPAESSTGPRNTARPNTPGAETTMPSDSVAGYRPMERDTTNVPSQHVDSARVTADTAEATPSDSSVSGIPSTTDTAAVDAAQVNTSSTEMGGATADTAVSTATITDTAASADTAAASYAEMARDTSPAADQADTAATPGGAVALQTTSDSSAQTGDVTTDEAADETADEQIVHPAEQETVAASETRTDEVGAAAVADGETGAGAAALMTRGGVRCAVVDPEPNEAVRWDMSSTPVTLNPCGMGSMNLSKIWTEGSEGRE